MIEKRITWLNYVVEMEDMRLLERELFSSIEPIAIRPDMSVCFTKMPPMIESGLLIWNVHTPGYVDQLEVKLSTLSVDKIVLTFRKPHESKPFAAISWSGDLAPLRGVSQEEIINQLFANVRSAMQARDVYGAMGYMASYAAFLSGKGAPHLAPEHIVDYVSSFYNRDSSYRSSWPVEWAPDYTKDEDGKQTLVPRRSPEYVLPLPGTHRLLDIVRVEGPIADDQEQVFPVRPLLINKPLTMSSGTIRHIFKSALPRTIITIVKNDMPIVLLEAQKKYRLTEDEVRGVIEKVDLAFLDQVIKQTFTRSADAKIMKQASLNPILISNAIATATNARFGWFSQFLLATSIARTGICNISSIGEPGSNPLNSRVYLGVVERPFVGAQAADRPLAILSILTNYLKGVYASPRAVSFDSFRLNGGGPIKLGEHTEAALRSIKLIDHIGNMIVDMALEVMHGGGEK